MRKSSGKGRKRTFLRLLLLGCLVAGLGAGIAIVSIHSWDGKSRFTLVTYSNPLILFSIEPETKRSVVVTLPSNTQLSLPFGYGTYPASSVYPLGNLDKKRGGGKLLTGAIEETLGVPVYGYISFPAHAFPSLGRSADIVSLKKNYFSYSGIFFRLFPLLSVLKNTSTNISLFDLYRLWSAVGSLKSDSILFIDMENEGLLQKQELPDGTILYTIDVDTFQNRYPDIFQDHRVRIEEHTVEVVNATGKQSVAQGFGRVLKTLGAHVVVKSTAVRENQASCVIHAASPDLFGSALPRRLLSFYPCVKGEGRLPTNVVDYQVVLGVGFIE